MIKNIVFDMGNVILRWDPQYIASRLTDNRDEQIMIEKDLFGSKYWQMLDQGVITVDEVIKQLGGNQVLINGLLHWYDYFEPYLEMIPLIKDLKEQGYQIYLLSNCSVQFDDYCKNVEAFRYFDGFYISALHQLLKPDVKIYQDFLTKFNLKGEECLFIDDVLDNVEGAKKAGMSAYHHNGDIEKLRLYLSKAIFRQ